MELVLQTIYHHARDLNSSWVMSRIKKPFWKRLFFGGSKSLLLRLGLTSSAKGFSSLIAVGTTREIGRERRLLLLVPMALEIESNGRIGFETGNEGIRRGGTVGEDVFVAFEDMLQANGLPAGG